MAVGQGHFQGFWNEKWTSGDKTRSGRPKKDKQSESHVIKKHEMIQQKPDPGPDPYVGLSGRLAVTKPFFKKGKVWGMLNYTNLTNIIQSNRLYVITDL